MLQVDTLQFFRQQLAQEVNKRLKMKLSTQLSIIMKIKSFLSFQVLTLRQAATQHFNMKNRGMLNRKKSLNCFLWAQLATNLPVKSLNWKLEPSSVQKNQFRIILKNFICYNVPQVHLWHDGCKLTKKPASVVRVNENFWDYGKSLILIWFCRGLKLLSETLRNKIGPPFSSQGAIKWFLGHFTTLAPTIVIFFLFFDGTKIKKLESTRKGWSKDMGPKSRASGWRSRSSEMSPEKVRQRQRDRN